MFLLPKPYFQGKTDELYIHHHLGLGDYFVCNSIIRNFYFLNKFKITIAVKNNNKESIKFLYSDININFDIVNNDEEAVSNYKNYQNVLRLGFENCNILNWEKSFYDQIHLDYNKRYIDFFVKRDMKREQKLLKLINPPREYAFCNKTCSEGFFNFKIKTKLPIIYLEKLTDNIFDWISIIENSKEIHTIDSSIFQLIKNLKFLKPKFFYDIRDLNISRTNPTFEDNNWNLINLK